MGLCDEQPLVGKAAFGRLPVACAHHVPGCGVSAAALTAGGLLRWLGGALEQELLLAFIPCRRVLLGEGGHDTLIPDEGILVAIQIAAVHLVREGSLATCREDEGRGTLRVHTLEVLAKLLGRLQGVAHATNEHM